MQLTHSRAPLFERVFSFFVAAVAAFALAGITHLKADLLVSLRDELTRFRWLVLVQGAQIDIDEVGRSLEHFPDVQEVSYVSPESAFSRLKNDAFLGANLSGLSASALPGAWNVRWTENFSVEQQDAFVAEARALPGVVDVAVDEKALTTIQTLRRHLLGTRVLLAGLWFLLVLVAVSAGVRFVISPVSLSKPERRIFLLRLASIAAGFVGGGLFAWLLMK